MARGSDEVRREEFTSVGKQREKARRCGTESSERFDGPDSSVATTYFPQAHNPSQRCLYDSDHADPWNSNDEPTLSPSWPLCRERELVTVCAAPPTPPSLFPLRSPECRNTWRIKAYVSCSRLLHLAQRYRPRTRKPGRSVGAVPAESGTRPRRRRHTEERRLGGDLRSAPIRTGRGRTCRWIPLGCGHRSGRSRVLYRWRAGDDDRRRPVRHRKVLQERRRSYPDRVLRVVRLQVGQRCVGGRSLLREIDQRGRRRGSSSPKES